MLLKALLDTTSFSYNIAYNSLEWFGVPLTQMSNAVQSTTSGYFLFENIAPTLFEKSASIFNYPLYNFIVNLTKHTAIKTATTAVLATAVGSVAAGSVAIASPLVVGTAAATAATLFTVKNLIGEEAENYTGAYIQYGTFGIALEGTTKLADYSMSFVREDWDKNYIANAKNTILSIDSLAGIISGKGSYLGGYMNAASKYLNGKIYNFLVNNSLLNGLFDLYAAYKLVGLAGLFANSLTNNLETGHQENLHQQLLEDIKQVNPEARNFVEPQRILGKELQYEMNRINTLEKIQQVDPEARNFVEPQQRILGEELQREMNKYDKLGKMYDSIAKNTNVLNAIKDANEGIGGVQGYLDHHIDSPKPMRIPHAVMTKYDKLGKMYDSIAKNTNVLNAIKDANEGIGGVQGSLDYHIDLPEPMRIPVKKSEIQNLLDSASKVMHQNKFQNALNDINKNVQKLDITEAPTLINHGLEAYQNSGDYVFSLEKNKEPCEGLKNSLSVLNYINQMDQQANSFNPDQCFSNSDNSLLNYNNDLQYNGGYITSTMNSYCKTELIGTNAGFLGGMFSNIAQAVGFIS